MTGTAQRVLRACSALRAGHPQQALDALSVEDLSPAAESLRLAAAGLLHEAADDRAMALECFRAVHELAVPLPALLAVAGEALARHGATALAYDCFAVLEATEPGSVARFASQLPLEQQVTCAPFLVPALLRAPRPLLYNLQPLKAELVRRLGAGGAAVAYAQAAHIPDAEISQREVSLLPDHARTHGQEFLQIADRRDVLLPAPERFGSPSPGPQAVRTRAAYLCLLHDVVVSSKSNLLHLGRQVLLDAHADELARYPLDLDVDPTVLAPDGTQVTTVLGRAAVVGNALSLVGVHSFNFGHWLVEFLPKVWACLDRPGFEDVTVLVDEQMHPALRPALEAFLPPGHPIRVLAPGEAVRVDRLWTLPMITYLPLGPRPGASDGDDPVPIDADLFASLVAKVEPQLRRFDPPGRAEARIYLSRQDSQHRRLVNRVEVERLVADRGFEVYDPGALSFHEQLRRVRSARTVVGPDGSALWLAFLAQRGARVGYLNNPYVEEHWWISANHQALGHRMLVLTGRVVNEVASYRKFSDYEIDVSVLAAYLDELEA